MLRVISLCFLVYYSLIIGVFDIIDLPISTTLFDIGTRVIPFILPSLFGLRSSLFIYIVFRLTVHPIDPQLLLEGDYDDIYITSIDRIYALGLISYIFISHLTTMQRKHEEEAVQQEINSKLELVRNLHNQTARQLTNALLDLYARNPSSSTTAILESALQSLQRIVQDVRPHCTDATKRKEPGEGMVQQRQIHEMVQEHNQLINTKDLTFRWFGINEDTIAPALASEIIFNAIKYAPEHSEIDIILSPSGSTNVLAVCNTFGETGPTYSSGFGLASIKQDMRKLGGACITLAHEDTHYALMQWPVDVSPEGMAQSLDRAPKTRR